MNFESKIKETLENKVLNRKLKNNICQTMDHECFKNIVSVVGLVDPTGLISIASPCIRPFCQDSLLTDKRKFK